MEEAPATEAAETVESVPNVTSEPSPANLLQDPIDSIEKDTSNEPWFNVLGEEYRNESSITKYDSLDDMAKGLINAQKLIGKKGIVRPDADATPEQWSDYYNQIGRPTESNMYKYDPIEGAPEVTQEDLNSFQEFAHSKGFTQDQFQAAIEYQYQLQQNAYQALEQEREAEINETKMSLIDEMGEVEFNAFIKDATQAANTLGLLDVLVDNGLANNKEVLKALAGAKKHLGSDSLVGEHKATTLDFDGQLNELRNHPGYSDKLHPMHNELLERRDKLYKQRYS